MRRQTMSEARPKHLAPGVAPAWNSVEMETAARESEGRECYREISAGEDHREGIVATAFPSSCVLFSLEVSLRLCRTEGEVRPVLLEQAAILSRRLERRGYSMNHLDDGWIVCEKPLLKEEIASEVDFLVRAIRSVNGANGGVKAPETKHPARRRRG